MEHKVNDIVEININGFCNTLGKIIELNPQIKCRLSEGHILIVSSEDHIHSLDDRTKETFEELFE